MPGKYEHQTTSALIAFLIELSRQLYISKQGIKIDPVESLLSLLIAPIAGAAGGVTPDLLEPATDPNHRAFCHSLTSGSAIGLGLSKIPLNTDSRNINLLNVCLRSSGVGYVTHLVQDAGTPMGLPVFL